MQRHSVVAFQAGVIDVAEIERSERGVGSSGELLAILHGGLEFRGAAGMFTLATLTMVVSGLVGRAVLSEGPVDATLTGAALTRAERRRHMLGLWWWLHIPVSSALWVLAVWHIATWVFYQTRAT